MILQCGVLFTFLAIGELVVWLTGIQVPSSIIAMLLLTLALKLRIVRLRHVERISNFLVHNLGFFFVPAGVGLMSCLGLIAEQWVPIVGSMVVSTAVILVVTGQVYQLVSTRTRRRHRNAERMAPAQNKMAE
ncbi:MAG: CidA/LrgA family protein [Muribaculaceae bacterium]|nr:CidA/LrgA family protein [Muribaculaceae bacterium]